MRRIAVVMRPPSRPCRVGELEEAAAALVRHGHSVRMQFSAAAGDARRLACRAAEEGFDVVAAAGGDGTVNEVVNGLVAASPDAPRPALAVIPMGTANDFARGLGLPQDPGAALRLAATGASSELDVVRVNDRCFINVSTGGFGAGATRDASRGAKRRLGALAYVLQGMRMLLRYDLTAAHFELDGASVYSGRYVFFAVGNARRTGGGAQVTPRADPGDGKLDIVILGDVSRLDFLTLLPDLRAGTHMESPDVLYLRGDALEVRSSSPLQVNADGEAVPGSAFRYEVLERRLRVIGAG
jgi:YegS/Rv2252/BmrU family lipid kinase